MVVCVYLRCDQFSPLRNNFFGVQCSVAEFPLCQRTSATLKVCVATSAPFPSIQFFKKIWCCAAAKNSMPRPRIKKSRVPQPLCATTSAAERVACSVTTLLLKVCLTPPPGTDFFLEWQFFGSRSHPIPPGDFGQEWPKVAPRRRNFFGFFWPIFFNLGHFLPECPECLGIGSGLLVFESG